MTQIFSSRQELDLSITVNNKIWTLNVIHKHVTTHWLAIILKMNLDLDNITSTLDARTDKQCQAIFFKSESPNAISYTVN